MTPIALPAFTDNCIWMRHDGREAVVVDPGDAAPVIAALDELQLALAAILVTHHQAAHVGSFEALRPRLQGPVSGAKRELIPVPPVPHADGDGVDVLGLRVEAKMARAVEPHDDDPTPVFAALPRWTNEFR